MSRFERVKALVGNEAYEKLKKSTVAVFGIGGVGGYVVEALARSGLGNVVIFDNDVVCDSNVNRQIIATTKTLGTSKVQAMLDRLMDINPEINVVINKVFYLPENADEFSFKDYDFVVDAVDTVSAKIEIISRAKKEGVEVISCMGTGAKLDPLKLKVSKLEDTKGCPLARVMRRELRQRNITGVKVVYSEEQPLVNVSERGNIPSMIFVPATAGLIIASEVIKDLINR